MWRDEEEKIKKAGRTFSSKLFREEAMTPVELFISLWRVIYYRQSKRLLRPRSVAAAAGDDRNHLFHTSHNALCQTSKRVLGNKTVSNEEDAGRWKKVLWWWWCQGTHHHVFTRKDWILSHVKNSKGNKWLYAQNKHNGPNMEPWGTPQASEL